MRDPKRIDAVIEVLTKIWKRYPDTRFNQLIHGLQHEFHEATNRGIKCVNKKDDYYGVSVIEGSAFDLFNVEDDDWLVFLQEYYERHKKE